MAVVITRVTPSMLPPTIITAPTSATARPKAVSSTVTTPKRRCTSIRSALSHGPAPIERSWSPPSARPSSTRRRVSAAISGTTRMLCATTMAVGVKRMPRLPNGPDRLSSRYTSSPTTTEGSASNVLTPHTATRWPGKRATASQLPSARPNNAPTAQAVRLTRKDSATMPARRASNCVISCQASDRLWAMESKGRMERVQGNGFRRTGPGERAVVSRQAPGRQTARRA